MKDKKSTYHQKTNSHIKMKYQKIISFLGTKSDNVIIWKWIEVHDQSGNAEDKQKRFKTSILRSDLCDFSDVYIVVKETIIVTNPDNNAYDKKLTFKKNAAFVSCVSNINNTLIENAEDFDIVMPMYNLLEYSRNF